MLRFPFVLLGVAVCVGQVQAPNARDDQGTGETPDRQRLVRALKEFEAQSGFAPTRNFDHVDPHVSGYYRCYFTGVLELPDSYDGLKLREGDENGCSIDTAKHDVFFYRIEAVASGKAPVTKALDDASDDRVAMVVPHEDFHAQVRDLPDRIAEAAATLVGFLTAEAVTGERGGAPGRPGDAELFLRKAEIVNRYFDRFSALYRGVREREVPAATALDRKRVLFAAVQKECAAIPAPRSFNRCLSAANNAGLAFDRTYTLYYPLLYDVFVAEGRDLKSTIRAIVNAPKGRREADVVSYFSEIVQSGATASQ